MAQTQVVNTTKTVELVKERSNMVKARKDAHLSQKDVAQKMNVDVKSVINWEKAHTDPRHYQIDLLREVIGFAGTDKELLQVFILEESNQEPCHQEVLHDTMNSSDHPFVIHIPRSVKGFRELMEMFRRQFIEALAQFWGVKQLDNISLALVSSPTVEPEEYLALCSESMGTWWGWLHQGNYHELERVLLKNVPVLKRLATTISPFQGIASSLVVETKIMQILLTTFSLQFSYRELCCVEAVQFGLLSGDSNLIALAQYWQGDTFNYCYNQPQKAIRYHNDALSNVDGSALIRSAIYSDLSIAHAQVGDEANALDYAVMARQDMPSRPELDPFHRVIDVGHSELDQFEGKTYLCLAERCKSRDYAQKAHSMLSKSVGRQAIRGAMQGQAYIRRADANRVLGDMNEFANDLTEGLGIAIVFRSQDHITHAHDIIGQVPPEWLQEKAVQDLQKEISHALVVARR